MSANPFLAIRQRARPVLSNESKLGSDFAASMLRMRYVIVIRDIRIGAGHAELTYMFLRGRCIHMLMQRNPEALTLQSDCLETPRKSIVHVHSFNVRVQSTKRYIYSISSTTIEAVIQE